MTTRRCICGAMLTPTVVRTYADGKLGHDVEWYCPNGWNLDLEHRAVADDRAAS